MKDSPPKVADWLFPEAPCSAVATESPARPGINIYDLLKVLAIGTMIIDHVNDFLSIHSLWLQAIGRMAMPIFLFLTGYNRRAAIDRSLVWAFFAVCLLQWNLRGTFLPLNILLPIALGRWILKYYATLIRSPWIELIGFVFIFSAAITSLAWEFGTIALLWALFGRLRREHHPMALFFGIVAGALLLIAYWPFFPHTHLLLVSTISLVTCALLKARPFYPLKPFPGTNTVKFVSRNSLSLYVLHLFLIALLHAICIGNRK